MNANQRPLPPIERADFSDPALAAFLRDHIADLLPTGPPDSQHALDLDGLMKPGVRLWVIKEGDTILGTAALAALADGHEEVKSMRTGPEARRRGVGRAMLAHVLADARSRGVQRVSLETGSMEFFAPARALYSAFGFVECGPFSNYPDDPLSTFMTLRLGDDSAPTS